MTNLQNYVLRKIIEQLDPEEQDALNALVQDLGADRPNASFVPLTLIDREIISWAHDFRSDMAWFLEIGSNELPEFKEFGKRMNIRCNALANRVKVLEAELAETKTNTAPADWMEERAKLIAQIEERTQQYDALGDQLDSLTYKNDNLTRQLEAAANVGYENTATIERLQKELEAAINVANLRTKECEALLADLQYARKELEAHEAGYESVSASSVPASNTVEPVFIEAKQVDTPIEVVTKKATREPTKFVQSQNDPALPCFTTPTVWEGELLKCGSFEIPVPVVKAAVLGLVAEQSFRDIAQNLTLRQDAVHAIKSSFAFGFGYLRSLDPKERGAHIDGYIAKKMGAK